jgi:hypothetical protein
MLGSEGALREASSKRKGKAMVGLNAGLGAAHDSELSKSYAREHSAFSPAFLGVLSRPACLALVNFAKSRRVSKA